MFFMEVLFGLSYPTQDDPHMSTMVHEKKDIFYFISMNLF